MSLPPSPRLGNSDRVAGAADLVHAVIVGEAADLIETVAERVADACLAFGGVERVAVTVHKPQAPITVPFDDVELRIVRERPGA